MSRDIVRCRLPDGTRGNQLGNLRPRIAEYAQDFYRMLSERRKVKALAPRFVREPDWGSDLVPTARICSDGAAFAEMRVLEYFRERLPRREREVVAA